MNIEWDYDFVDACEFPVGATQAGMAHDMTADQVKEKFKQEGRTFTQWASENGYTRADVYKALNGQSKNYWGKGHAIAVGLGLKKAVTA